MIELDNNELIFRFPKVHPNAMCTIDFQRTLRIPDDNRDYPLPPGLGSFPIAHVDDFDEKLPATWHQHGGVFIPMYQSEALWINFSGNYPCAVKIATGRINAVSGEQWINDLSDDPQDYVVIPSQKWLDGFNVSEGHIRQFVAMQLGDGCTAEEQITGSAEHGGIQIVVYPMKEDSYREYCGRQARYDMSLYKLRVASGVALDMGLAPGGLMRQEIHEDSYGLDAWDQGSGSRCFVHLTNSAVYQEITGHQPPHEPVTSRDYTEAGLPWFSYYSDKKALSGADNLSGLTSVAAKMIEKGKGFLSDNDPVEPKIIKAIREGKVVSDGDF